MLCFDVACPEAKKLFVFVYYISPFHNVISPGKLANWKMRLSEFDIVYVTQKAIKVHALADHLAENPVDKGYEQLKTYFHDEDV